MADDDIYAALMRFHREIIVPEIRDPLQEQIRATEKLRNEMLTGFDGVYKKIGILETEMALMRGAVRDLERQVAGLTDRIAAVEGRLTRVEEKLDRFALRSEVAELREQLETLQQRIAEIESLLNEH